MSTQTPAPSDVEERPEPEPIAPTPMARRSKPWLLEVYSTAVGKKYVMAITGIIGLGYIVAHMIGNLKAFFGPTALNEYGEWLRESLLYPILPHTWALWGMRAVLILAVVLHVHAAYGLTRVNMAARPVPYQSKRDYVAANFAARTMRWTGVIVFAFIIYHLADFTWGVANPGFERGEVYRNLVASFERWPVAVTYIIANVLLGVHIYHGIWSMFQSLGINNRRFNHLRKALAVGFTVVVIGGFIAVPIAALAGIID